MPFSGRPKWIKSSTYEIIESYPEDKYLPSSLVYAASGNEVFHVLLAVDVPAENVRVVTAYRPDPGAWETDQKTWSKDGSSKDGSSIDYSAV